MLPQWSTSYDAHVVRPYEEPLYRNTCTRDPLELNLEPISACWLLQLVQLQGMKQCLSHRACVHCTMGPLHLE